MSIDRFRRSTARRLRATSTLAERKLWQYLKRPPVIGSHFRRQVPIGPYVADFACMAAKLVIEIDGSQHGEEGHAGRDAVRTKWLEDEGYKVIRFWNSEVTDNIEGVLTVIHAAVYGSVDIEPKRLKHNRVVRRNHPTPARSARRPSPSMGG